MRARKEKQEKQRERGKAKDKEGKKDEKRCVTEEKSNSLMDEGN